MNLNLNKLNITFSLYIIAVIANYFIFPNLIFVQIFSIFYIILIYKYFSKNYIKYVAYNTVFLSIVAFSLAMPLGQRFSLYYMYLSLALYYGYRGISAIKSGSYKNKSEYYKGEFKHNRYFRFSVIFIVYLIAGVIFFKSFGNSYRILLAYIIMIPFSAMVYMENRSIKDIKRTLQLLLYIFLGVLLIGTLEVLGFRFGMRTNYLDMGINVKEYFYFNRIPITFFYNQNDYAVFLVLGMSGLFSSFLFAKNNILKLGCLILFVIGEINLIFTTGRISWITIIILPIFTLVSAMLIKQWRIARVSVGFFAMILIIFVSFSMIPEAQPYYGKINDIPFMKILNAKKTVKINNLKQLSEGEKLKLGENGSLNERYTVMLDIAKGVTLEKNVLGFGAGNTMNYLAKSKNTHGITNPHGMWLEVLGDFGIFIFLYYLYVYAYAILKMIFSYNKIVEYDVKKCLIIVQNMFFVFAILSFAPSTVVGYAPFWVLIALSFGFARAIEVKLLKK